MLDDLESEPRYREDEPDEESTVFEVPPGFNSEVREPANQSLETPEKDLKNELFDQKSQKGELENIGSGVETHEQTPGFKMEVEVSEIMEPELDPKKPEDRPSYSNIFSQQPETQLTGSLLGSQTSMLTPEMREEVKQIFREMAQNELKASLTSIPRPNEQTSPFRAQRIPQEKVAHPGIICDGCGMNPIVGPRYVSLERANYDLCENCVKKMHLEHPMVMLRKPGYSLNGTAEWKAMKAALNNSKGKSSRQPNSGFMRAVLERGASNQRSGSQSTQGSQGSQGGGFFQTLKQGFQVFEDVLKDTQGGGESLNLMRRSAPVVTQGEPSNPHLKLDYYSNIFKNVPRKELNDFLYRNGGNNSEDQLCIMILEKFSSYMK